MERSWREVVGGVVNQYVVLFVVAEVVNFQFFIAEV